MNTSTDTPESARHETGEIVIVMHSGDTLRFPIAASPRLASATYAQLDDITLSPFGLHWPQLDEDLSIRGIIEYLKTGNR